MDPRTTARVLDLLCEVTGSDRPRNEPDLALYGSGLVDSLGTVSLIAALEEGFGVVVSPAEFDPAAWATPRLVLADVAARLADSEAAAG